MDLLLRRQVPTGNMIFGELDVDGDYECLTLERFGVQIPPGCYGVTLFMSPHFNCRVPRLQDVPYRDAIEIHVGNVPSDTRGCILVGTYSTPRAVLNSHTALLALVDKISAALARGERVWITLKAPIVKLQTT